MRGGGKGKSASLYFFFQKGGELTALHLAAKYGHMEVCRLLLAHGASPDIAATSASCFTPLHLAVMNGHSDVAALLLQSGASANSIAAVRNFHSVTVTTPPPPPHPTVLPLFVIFNP